MSAPDFQSVRKLYHGSDVAVRAPDPFYSAIKKDSGQGFYASVEVRSAELWAKRVYHRNLVSGRRPTVNAYDFAVDERARIHVFDGDSESDLDAWVDFVVYNRQLFSFVKNPLAQGYDLVVGLIADGEWADLFEPFERRVRSERDYAKEKRRLLEDLMEIEASRKLGHQFCFKTPAAVSMLGYDARGSYRV
jgi:hypothetical protein